MAKSQKGFTLLEILVVLAVGGILLASVVTAIFQTVRVTAQSTTQIAALEDIKNAAYHLSKDVRMAATTDLEDGADPVSSLTLDWTSWYDSNGQLSSVNRQAEYTLSGKKLLRAYDPNTALVGDEATATVGKFISSIEFSRQGQIIVIAITSSPEGKAETAEQKTFRLYLQPKENPLP